MAFKWKGLGEVVDSQMALMLRQMVLEVDFHWLGNKIFKSRSSATQKTI